MTLNNKNRKKTTTHHLLKITNTAWYALQRAKITAEESGDPKTPGDIASGIILDRLGG